METIHTFTMTVKEVRKGTQSFLVGMANIANKWYKIKFNRSCNDTPKERGIYDITIDFDSCSVERGKKYTREDGTEDIGNDTIWIANIVNLRKWSDEDMRERNRKNMAEIFGE